MTVVRIYNTLKLMGVERQIPLLPELESLSIEFAPKDPPRHIKASEQLHLNIDDRVAAFHVSEYFRFEVDMLGVKLVQTWRIGKGRVNIMNGSVNPLGTLSLDSDQWREMGYFGGKDGSIPLPKGVLIEGHISMVKNDHSSYAKIPILDKVVLPLRNK